ncbi:MAG: NADP-dependent phosphogluconate dehydrogenase [Chitinophagaceae bacterium]|nr:NADP-dependent phosphogluconate dehydrogenase [Chitinophagaceae bacterium]
MAAHFGMIGLGTMGSNLVLNVADHGFEACGYDRDPAQQKKLMEEAGDRPVTTAATLPDFVKALKTPRVIMLLVPAGKIVDNVINDLLPLVQKGDIIIDGGNSHFVDTDRRYLLLQNSGVHFIGMGVSGGEEGARLGPSLMPGGNKESYELVKDVLSAIAAKTDEGPCVAFIGNTAAGHYTKMVHNGIEYAMMQLISEVYGILKSAGQLSNTEFHELFKSWNKSVLQSFLIEITADIFLKKDEELKEDLVDFILDKAKQKGTGMWTSQSAMDLNVSIPTIDAAVSMRYLSALKDERVKNSKLYPVSGNGKVGSKEQLIALCQNALHFGFLLSYGQGLQLLNVASAQYNYAIDIAEIIRVWKGGCIIRSGLLNDLRKAYLQEKTLSNIISSPLFVPVLVSLRKDVAALVKVAIDHQLPLASLSASLNYFDAYITGRLPANLIQAQRDFFGAHTYERLDKEGVFHTEWVDKPPVVTSTQKPKEE